jgi:RNA polymerase sigma factor (sigma-70 family)
MDARRGTALLQHHRDLTARLSRRIGRSEAEDLASEAVARGLGRPAPDGRQAPWIERICHNLFVDSLRRRFRREAVEAVPEGRNAGEATAVVLGAAATAGDGGGASPEEALLAHERRQALAKALPEMPDELRQAVVARFFEDRDYAEMAAACGITTTTARTRVHRALASLRQRLGGLRSLLPLPLGGASAKTGAAAGAGTGTMGTSMSGLAAVVPVMVTALVAAPMLFPAARADGWAAAGQPIVLAQAETQPRRTVRTAPAIPREATPPAAVERRRPEAAKAAPEESSGYRAPPAVQRIDYGDDEIVGDIARPDGEPDFVDVRAKHESLIEIPRTFAPSIAKMVEDL